MKPTVALLLLLNCLFILNGCGNSEKPKSGKSSVVIENTVDPDKGIEIKSSDAPSDGPVVTLDEGPETSDEIYEQRKEELEKQFNEALEKREEETVRISGYLIGGEGLSITIDKLGGEKRVEPIKTTVINEEGYFELDATTKQPQIFNLRTEKGNMILFCEGGGNYEVSATLGQLSEYQVKNAPESRDLRDFYLILETFNEKSRALDKRIDDEKKAWKLKRLLDSMTIYNNEIQQAKSAAIKNFAENHRKSVVAAIAVNRLDFVRHTAYIEGIYEGLAEKYPYSSYVKNIGKKLVRVRPVAVGKEAPAFTLQDIESKNHRLSDFSGKTRLLLFTNAYQKQSIEMAEQLKPIYAKYKGEGFEIINIAVEDKREDWQAYLNETEVPWIVLSDLMGQRSTIFDHYIAYQFPMTYLIGPDGKILDKFLSADEVESYLNQNL